MRKQCLGGCGKVVGFRQNGLPLHGNYVEVAAEDYPNDDSDSVLSPKDRGWSGHCRVKARPLMSVDGDRWKLAQKKTVGDAVIGPLSTAMGPFSLRLKKFAGPSYLKLWIPVKMAQFSVLLFKIWRIRFQVPLFQWWRFWPLRLSVWSVLRASLQERHARPAPVLAIARPLCLGLATPTALIFQTGRVPRWSSDCKWNSSSRSAKIQTVCAFDKTGTITIGQIHL